jgi:hypothetical protein
MNNAEELDEAALRDANGRTFRFDELFGDRSPLKTTVKQVPANKARVSNCLLQLSPERQPSPQRRHLASVSSAAAVCSAGSAGSAGASAAIDSKAAYVQGVTDPWDSIDFNVAEGLQQDVGFRTRVDCGLAIRRLDPVSPSRRQMRLLQEANGVMPRSPEPRSPEFSEKKVPRRPPFLKHDSQLQLQYLANN